MTQPDRTQRGAEKAKSCPPLPLIASRQSKEYYPRLSMLFTGTMMRLYSIKFDILALVFVTLAVTPDNAFAYLDASSGSMILQLMLGGVAGLVVALRMYGRRFLNFFSRSQNSDSNDSSNKH